VTNEQQQHIPVLVDQLVALVNPSPGMVGVDCTLGGGGHALAICRAVKGDITLFGIDVDPVAIELARGTLADFSASVTTVQGNFAAISQILSEHGHQTVNFIYADLGTSSMQLAAPGRGFSFCLDGPLDMRLDPELTTRAADLVNSLKETELGDLIFRYGEEPKSRKIARLICQARRGHRLDSTRELADLVCQALGIDPDRLRPGRIHPATKTFQALRIAVNDELGRLERLLEQVDSLLAPGGRFAVISFHSLEDALVKEDFRRKEEKGIYRPLTKKPVVAEQSEIIRNSRSRSAKLRAVEKVS